MMVSGDMPEGSTLFTIPATLTPVITLDTDDGTVTMETNADADDITYDEVSAGLLIGEVRRQRQDLFEAMQMYYRIYILKENPADILTGEDE